MNITAEKKKNFWLNRFVPAIVIVVILALSLVTFAYSFRPNLYSEFSTAGFWVLRVFSLFLIGAVVAMIFYELSHAYSEMLVPSIILTILYVASMLLGKDFFSQILFGRLGSSYVPVMNIDNIGYLFTEKFEKYIFDYWVLITTFIVALIFLLIRLTVVKNITIKYLIFKTLSLWVISIILTLFVKTFIVLLTQSYGIELILFFIIIASSYDIGGYFGGRFLGHKMFKSKLAPTISPKKTWEGAIIGYIVSFAATMIYIFIAWGIRGKTSDSVAGILLNSSSHFFPYLLSFLFIAPLIALFGDLFFSLVKRRNEIKDFSNILKEHGGLLDRIDSISFVFVFFGILAACSTL
ncbi:phosphatidate cytidylyltransferase [Mycoplasma seminis]|uniref:Phosphatidate cytidylyltransferase n=1 Tax=Mycoplasma seminis TaxID=512749 RepID=A0ABY9HAB9_9MOLU|nr:phosphatidate cytidylyltransferase [Mycoplasma seminis]WLP85482.1 phosphatidate cytidylyltransferase [Mycoplasma seminis]